MDNKSQLRARAVWQGKTLAESDDIVFVEGNAYFPRASLNSAFLEESDHHTTCYWKGEASYLHAVVDGERLENAAWYYPQPKFAARKIRDRVAFWNGVEVLFEGEGAPEAAHSF